MNQLVLFEQPLPVTPIAPLRMVCGQNRFWIKRDDLLPFSFGGNKVRKAAEFYKEIKESGADVVMTYGSNSSNHCRIIANMAAAMGLQCHVISPEEHREVLYNTKMVSQFGAAIETCPVSEVAQTIENRKACFVNEGKKPYFITGGGHGNPGTHSYVRAYDEICTQEAQMGVHFDYIFHASGTGATQAGLVCGQLLAKDESRRIVGISIAREKERGREVVRESIEAYLGADYDKLYRDDALIFEDAYRCGGYGMYSPEILEAIDRLMSEEGIPTDTTYVGKAFWGMLQYLQEKAVSGKKILFLHTGGTPLFFDKL
ncbi:MAG: pyridoxal-phosphate dependent enzyme [Lachnospiraceae bacterium]|nr:pyridoxal-phosphate dependent enzyme [Lachnospiraceae bacterium]